MAIQRQSIDGHPEVAEATEKWLRLDASEGRPSDGNHPFVCIHLLWNFVSESMLKTWQEHPINTSEADPGRQCKNYGLHTNNLYFVICHWLSEMIKDRRLLIIDPCLEADFIYRTHIITNQRVFVRQAIP